MKPNLVTQSIIALEKRFGQPHLDLACHAAFPLALTSDLLYRLWVNFQCDCEGQPLNIPWVAVADLMLSSLCEEVGYGLYEMPPAVRATLLDQLKANPRFGPGRIRQLAEFLLIYVQPQIYTDDPDLQDLIQAQKWTALAHTQPAKAARELAAVMANVSHHDKTEWVRMASLVNGLESPLADFKPLLTYARGMGCFAQGTLPAAATQFRQLKRRGQQVRISSVNLPIPVEVNAYFSQQQNLVRHQLLQWSKPVLKALRAILRIRDRRVIGGGIAGLCITVIGGLIAYQGLARAKEIRVQITKCEQPFSFTQAEVVTPTALVNQANAVQEACSTLIEAGNTSANAYKHRGQAKLVLRQADLRLAVNSNEEQDIQKLESILSDFEAAYGMDDPDPQVFFYLGLYADLTDQPETAANHYNQAIALYSQNPDTLTQADFPILGELGRFLIQQYEGRLGPSELRQIQGIYDLAEAALSSTDSALLEEVELNRNRARIKYNLGILSTRAFNNVAAIENLEEATKLDPDFELAQIALSFTLPVVGSGNSQASMATFTQAIQDLNEFFNQPGNQVDVYTILLSKVATLLLNEQYDQAFATIDAANPALIDQLPGSIKRIQQEWGQMNDWQRRNERIQTPLTVSELESIMSALFPDIPVYGCQQYPVLAIANTPNNPVCYGAPIL